MWLIDTVSLELKQFPECPRDTYAILSHTWGSTDEEVTFEEFKLGTDRQKKVGFQKIQRCCQRAWEEDGLQYAWIDTCCIDKSSSAELSEAINSMFKWYECSRVCYAYLSDVSSCEPHSFTSSRWFTRGWTLQELIAPKTVSFFSRDWEKIGDKSSLGQTLQMNTGIPVDVLTSKADFLDFSLAHRMSWASERETTRVEDGAYCLLGLFNINMPLLYGEGSKAFLRLQETIIQQTDDETIFTWTGVPPQGSGLLAPTAAYFARCANVQRGKRFRGRPPYTKTNRGWSIECEMIPCAMNTYAVPLQCSQESNGPKTPQIGIFLCRTEKDDQYRRISFHGKCITAITQLDRSDAEVRQVSVSNDERTARLVPHSYLPSVRIESDLRYALVPGNEKEAMHYAQPGAAKRTAVDLKLIESGKNFYGAPVRMSERTTTLQFQYQQFENGIVVAFVKPVVLGKRRYYYLQAGFDANFNPVCILRYGPIKWISYILSIGTWRHKVVDSLVAEILFKRGFMTFHEPLLKPLPQSGAERNIPCRLLFLSDDVVRTLRGDRIDGLREKVVDFLPQEYGCVELVVDFHPLDDRASCWRLSLRERSVHPDRLFCGVDCHNHTMPVKDFFVYAFAIWLWLTPVWIVANLALMYHGRYPALLNILSITDQYHFTSAIVIIFITDRISSLYLPVSTGLTRMRFAALVTFVMSSYYQSSR